MPAAPDCGHFWSVGPWSLERNYFMGWADNLKRSLLVKGGVHPPASKLAAGVKISDGPKPKRVLIPLSQHVGAACEPLVEKGDRVLLGQKIGDSDSYISAPVHSSVSGEVTSIQRFPHPSGRDVLTVEISSDGEDAPAPGLGPAPDPLSMEPGEIRRRVREGGIVGLGGAVFPTHVKLSPPSDRPIEAVIVNGAECEPFLTGDYRLMLERGQDIIHGARIIRRAVGAERIIIAIEQTGPKAIAAMREAVPDDGIEVFILPGIYPQGAEKTLVKTVLGREVPSGGLPMDVGAIVDNVGTCAAISELFLTGMPLTRRIVTVAGDGVAGRANLEVRIGTVVREVIDFCGGLSGDPGKVILGGPMMGLAQYTMDVPVTKATGGILVFKKGSVFCEEPGHFSCIRCGRCVRRCPMNLRPYLLGSYSDAGMWDHLEDLYINDCMECGSCAYICPTKNPLVQLIKVGKEGFNRRKRKMEALAEKASEEAEEKENAGKTA